MSGSMEARRRCGVIIGDATSGRRWVGVKAKVVVGLVVLEASPSVGLPRTVGGVSLDGTEGHNATDPDWDIMVGDLVAVEGAGTVVSAFVAVRSAVG